MQLPKKAIGRMAKCSVCGMTFLVPVHEGEGPAVVKPCSPPPRGADLDVNTPPPKPAVPRADASEAGTIPLKPLDQPAAPPAGPPVAAVGARTDLHLPAGANMGRRMRLRHQKSPFLRIVVAAVVGLVVLTVVIWVAFEVGSRAKAPSTPSTPSTPPAPRIPRVQPPPTHVTRPPLRPTGQAPADSPTARRRRQLAGRLAEILTLEHDQPELALARYVQLGREFTEATLYPVGFRIDEKISLMRNRVAGISSAAPQTHGVEVVERLRLFVPEGARRGVCVMGYLSNTSDRLIEGARIRITVPGAGGRAASFCEGGICFIPPMSRLVPFVLRVHGVSRSDVRTPKVSACVIDKVRVAPGKYIELPILPGFRLSGDRRTVTGDVKNDLKHTVQGVRVMCEIFRSDGLLLMREETLPADAAVPLRPGDVRRFRLAWTERIENDGDAEVYKIVCRAVGSVLSP